jgi:hypothetical protein
VAALFFVLLSLVTLSVATLHLAAAAGSGPGRRESVRLLAPPAAAQTFVQYSARGRHAFFARFATPNPGWSSFRRLGAASAFLCDVAVRPPAPPSRREAGRSPPPFLLSA